MDRVILHIVMHHSTYVPNFIEIEETFFGQTDGQLRPTVLGRLRGVDLKTEKKTDSVQRLSLIYEPTFSNISISSICELQNYTMCFIKDKAKLSFAIICQLYAHFYSFFHAHAKCGNIL